MCFRLKAKRYIGRQASKQEETFKGISAFFLKKKISKKVSYNAAAFLYKSEQSEVEKKN